MRASFHIPRGLDYYDAALEGLTRVNEDILRRERAWPSIYDGRVRYQREDKTEDWRNVGEVMVDGYGDCEDLACALTAWRRVRLGDKKAKAFSARSGPNMVHIKVRHGDGTVEDPSLKLGMGREGGVILMQGNDDFSGYDEEEMGADVSNSAEVTWSIEPLPGGKGWRGTVRIPLWQGKALMIKRGAATQEGAAKTALNVASKVLSNPAIAAVIPPEAKFALNLVRSPKARAMAKSLINLF